MKSSAVLSSHCFPAKRTTAPVSLQQNFDFPFSLLWYAYLPFSFSSPDVTSNSEFARKRHTTQDGSKRADAEYDGVRVD